MRTVWKALTPQRLRQGSHDKPRALEPIAAIGHPPAQDADGDGGEQTPQERQRNIGDQTERDEHGPKDFTLHFYIVARPGVPAEFR